LVSISLEDFRILATTTAREKEEEEKEEIRHD